MAPLLGLSSELLYQICVLVDCEDLVNFSSINRQLYLVAQPLIEKRRPLWNRFNSLSDGGGTSCWFWYHLARCLLTTSQGAPYIRNISIGSQGRSANFRAGGFLVKDWNIDKDCEEMVEIPSNGGGLFRSPHRSGPPALAAGSAQIFYERIDASSWLTQGERYDMKTGIHNGNQHVIRAILLPLLPNLQTLRITSSSSPDDHLLRSEVKYAAIAHSQQKACEAFRSLRTLDVNLEETVPIYPNSNQGTGVEYSLVFLAAFMALPNLRRVFASGVRGSEFQQDPQLPPSNVTDITFLQADVSALAFERLLDKGAPLQHLCLQVHHDPQWFNEEGLGKVLLGNAQNSLERLELTKESYIGWKQSYMGIQLGNFTKLKEIVIEYDFLHPNDTGSLFPTSLEKLTLTTVRYRSELPRHALDILDEKDHSIPRLTELSVHCWLDKGDETALAAACQQHKVTWNHLTKQAHVLDITGGSQRGIPRAPRLALPPRYRY